MMVFLKIANKYNIVDKPNGRSSHKNITIRGGGGIWWLAGVIYAVFDVPGSVYFLTGITLISFISFWDDISSLPVYIRLIVHFLAISVLFYGFGIF
jgi:UDP-N-acetylmuramyl pentapeptide phosphotransferase/UDP-N-acetylglucosamine-1-phosphate transferase